PPILPLRRAASSLRCSAYFSRPPLLAPRVSLRSRRSRDAVISARTLSLASESGQVSVAVLVGRSGDFRARRWHRRFVLERKLRLSQSPSGTACERGPVQARLFP